jgi:hypothetical protein
VKVEAARDGKQQKEITALNRQDRNGGCRSGGGRKSGSGGRKECFTHDDNSLDPLGWIMIVSGLWSQMGPVQQRADVAMIAKTRAY